MRLFILAVIIVLLVVTIVAAVVFRSRRALGYLHLLRRLGWVYVIVIVLAAAYRLWLD
jgi:hypothetical protein